MVKSKNMSMLRSGLIMKDMKLWLKKKEMREKYDNVVHFADICDLHDQIIGSIRLLKNKKQTYDSLGFLPILFKDMTFWTQYNQCDLVTLVNIYKAT